MSYSLDNQNFKLIQQPYENFPQEKFKNLKLTQAAPFHEGY